MHLFHRAWTIAIHSCTALPTAEVAVSAKCCRTSCHVSTEMQLHHASVKRATLAASSTENLIHGSLPGFSIDVRQGSGLCT